MARYPDLPVIGWNSNRFLVGLTGGIGSGKSSAARLFADAGALVLDADRLAHEVLRQPTIIAKLKGTFGSSILDKDGQINRTSLAGKVFEHPAELEKLNAIVHPGVRDLFQNAVEQSPAGSIIVYDVPLLFEAGLAESFDQTVVITAPAEVRQLRVAARNGWSAREFAQREARQMPLSQKEELADLIIENQSSEQDLQAAIQQYYAAIQAAAHGEKTDE